MESQPQNPEFRNDPENFYPCGSVVEMNLRYRCPWFEPY